MYILFIDTHDILINICLYKDKQVLDYKTKESFMHHTDYVMPILDELLKRNNLGVKDLNEVIVVNGPGSFTGVRIGVTIGKMLAYTLNIPIKSITSLEMYAVSSKNEQNKLVLIHDVKGVYGAIFDKDNNIILDYFYKDNKEYEDYLKKYDYILVENKIDYLELINYVSKKEEINPHVVNPIYIKMIEALKND